MLRRTLLRFHFRTISVGVRLSASRAAHFAVAVFWRWFSLEAAFAAAAPWYASFFTLRERYFYFDDYARFSRILSSILASFIVLFRCRCCSRVYLNSFSFLFAHFFQPPRRQRAFYAAYSDIFADTCPPLVSRAPPFRLFQRRYFRFDFIS